MRTAISNIADINAKLTDVQPGSVNIRVQPACQATGEGLGHAPFRVRDAARERIFFVSAVTVSTEPRRVSAWQRGRPSATS